MRIRALDGQTLSIVEIGSLCEYIINLDGNPTFEVEGQDGIFGLDESCMYKDLGKATVSADGWIEFEWLAAPDIQKV